MRGEREGKRTEHGTPSGDGSAGTSRALTALTTSALAVPGLVASAAAESPIEQASAGYAFSYYAEDDLESDKLASGSGTGSRDRYEVLTHQFDFDLPVSERMDMGVDFLYEEMSGASPWFVVFDTTNNRIAQVMSGATIDDTRYDLSTDLDYYLENAKDTASLGFSKENDYLSVHGGIGTERSFADNNTTFSTSIAYSHDWIEPNRDGFPSRQRTGEKWSVDLFAGISQVLTRSSIVQLTANYKHSDGYLSDPYKLITDGNGSVGNLPDQRPDLKDQVSLLARYRQHIEPISASIHFDYRFYVDTWQVTSHTFDLAWHQNLFQLLTITPGFRYYSQSKAEFYETVLPVGVVPDERSNDFRLSPYGAISWKVRAEVALEDLIDYRAGGTGEKLGFSGLFDLLLAFSYERYLSDGAFAIVSVDDVDEAPGLVNFQVFAVTLNGRF